MAIGAGWVELRTAHPHVEGVARGLGAAPGAAGTTTAAAAATATASLAAAKAGRRVATAKATCAANSQALNHPRDQVNLDASADDGAVASGYDSGGGGGNGGVVDGVGGGSGVGVGGGSGSGSGSGTDNTGGAHGVAQWWVWVTNPFRQLGIMTSRLTATFGFGARKRPRPDEEVDGTNEGADSADGGDGAQGGQPSRKRQRKEPPLATGAPTGAAATGAATGAAAAGAVGAAGAAGATAVILGSSGDTGGLERGSRVGSRVKSRTSVALLDPLFSVETHRLVASVYTHNFDDAGNGSGDCARAGSGWMVETDIVRLACFVDMWRRGYVLGVSHSSPTATPPHPSSEESAHYPTTNRPAPHHRTT